MILFRCFPWDREAKTATRGGPLWFPRMLQGAGRHDNPLTYGCLYVSEVPLSPVVERLARFRGRELTPDKLVSFGRALALAAIELSEEAELVNLDEPRVLAKEGLRPSQVATNDRSVTQVQAGELFSAHEGAVGLRWWSTFESLWANVTLFDRAGPVLEVADLHALDVGDDVVRDAAEFLGLPISA